MGGKRVITFSLDTHHTNREGEEIKRGKMRGREEGGEATETSWRAREEEGPRAKEDEKTGRE